jgi:glucose/mannose transport system substrate-binding protein
MNILKSLLTAAAATTLLAGTAFSEPKALMLHQWATGNDAASIAKLGEMFTAKGGKWEQTAVAGHTANTLAKLRADVLAGNAPSAVQLKGPEIAEWNETGKTANLDELAAAEGCDEAQGFLGCGTNEHSPHQLAVGLIQGHGRRRCNRDAQDLG